MQNTTMKPQEILKSLNMDFTGVILTRQDYFFRLNLRGQDEISYPPDNSSSTLDEREQAFESIKERLSIISSEEDEEDFTYKPSELALELVSKLVKLGYLLSSGKIVRPLIAADGQGGLKFDWRTPEKEIRLFIPAKNNRTPYLYHREGVEDDIVNDPSGDILAFWLTWLCK